MTQRLVISTLFFCSGFAGLVFEIIWSRQLLRVLGSGTIANACVFAAFMAGCAIGAFFPVLEKTFSRDSFGKRIADGVKKAFYGKTPSNLRAYGRLELFCGLSGLFLYFLLLSPLADLTTQLLGRVHDIAPEFANFFRFFICFLLLLPPCAAMGATFRMVTEAYSAGATSKQEFALLYGANTSGAAIGCIASGSALLPTLGLRATCLATASLYLLIFVVVEILASSAKDREIKRGREPVATAEQRTTADQSTAEQLTTAESQTIEQSVSLSTTGPLVCVFLSGFLALILELSWTRVFSMVLGGSVYSLSIVLFIILLATGVASLTVSRLRMDAGTARLGICSAFFLAGLSLIISTSSAQFLIDGFYTINSNLSGKITQDTFFQAIFSRTLIALIFIFPSTFFLGSILPLASRAYADSKSTSILYALNCTGAAIASLLFVSLIFPLLAKFTDFVILYSFLMVASGSILTSVFLCYRELLALPLRPGKLSIALTLGILIAPLSAIWIKPAWPYKLLSSGQLLYQNVPSATEQAGSVIFYKEGLNSTVTVTRNPNANTISLRNDGKVEASQAIEPGVLAAGADSSTQLLLSILPILMTENEDNQKAKSAFVIGLGSGITAIPFIDYCGTRNLTVAELEPAVLDAAMITNPALLAISDDIKFSDARFLLSTSPQLYEAISSQPADPWVAGSADLYTREFWELAKSRLREGGIFCQWVQLYAIPEQTLQTLIKTFQTVFPSTYICHPPGAGEIILVGQRTANKSHGLETLLNNTGRRMTLFPELSKYSTQVGIVEPWDLGAILLAGPDDTKKLYFPNTPLNTDDKSIAEYTTANRMLAGSSDVENNLKFLLSQLRLKTVPNPERLVKSPSSLPPETLQLGGTAASFLARAYARQYIQDASELRHLTKERAIEAANFSIESSPRALTFWQRFVVNRALKISADKTDLENAKNALVETNIDRLALFDLWFEEGKMKEAQEQLALCNKRTQLSPQWKLRQGFFCLRNDQPQEAIRNFDQALVLSPNSLPLLLARTYAALKIKDISGTEKYIRKYLFFNPWDFEAQRLAALVLSQSRSDSLCMDHASSAALLRPGDGTAFLLVIAYCKSIPLAKILQKASKLAPDDPGLTLVDRITENGKFPERLADNSDFKQLLKEIQAKSEDPISGYKILGEP